MSDYCEAKEKLHSLELQLEDAEYKGEKFRAGLLKKKIEALINLENTDETGDDIA